MWNDFETLNPIIVIVCGKRKPIHVQLSLLYLESFQSKLYFRVIKV